MNSKPKADARKIFALLTQNKYILGSEQTMEMASNDFQVALNDEPSVCEDRLINGISNTKINSVGDRDLKKQLAEWAIQHSIANGAINSLPQILNQHHKDLPLDARTLKSTPKCPDIEAMGSGELMYYGLKDS